VLKIGTPLRKDFDGSRRGGDQKNILVLEPPPRPLPSVASTPPVQEGQYYLMSKREAHDPTATFADATDCTNSSTISRA